MAESGVARHGEPQNCVPKKPLVAAVIVVTMCAFFNQKGQGNEKNSKGQSCPWPW